VDKAKAPACSVGRQPAGAEKIFYTYPKGRKHARVAQGVVAPWNGVLPLRIFDGVTPVKKILKPLPEHAHDSWREFYGNLTAMPTGTANLEG